MFLLMLNIVFSDSIIQNSSIVYKELAIAIARWETGHYSSVSYKRDNNLFGWRRNGKSLKFKSKQSSVLSYQKFEERVIRKYNIKTEKQYLNIINRFYSRDKKRWKQKILIIQKKHFPING